MSSTSLLIRPYQPADHEAVNALIRGIQKTEQRLDLVQPELHDIERFYQVNGNFWVALIERQIIGTAALLLLGDGIAKLGKMFVVPAHRGGPQSAAKSLLETALSWGESQRVDSVYLETIVEPCAAQSFYLKNGFLELSRSELPTAFKVCPYPSRYFVRKLGKAE